MSEARRPGALLVLLACALVGHLWMQSAGMHTAANPATQVGVHGHEAGGTGDGLDGGHAMAAGCVAVLAVVALTSPRLRAWAGRTPGPGTAAPLLTAMPSALPLRPPRPPRAPVEQGVLLRV